MAAGGVILVDTSVWIRYFRVTDSLEAKTLDALLDGGPVATCAPVRAEVVSGAPTPREFQRLRRLFDALVWLAPADDCWTRLEASRFALARRGYQASLIDLLIALTAQAHEAALWTLDDDFERIAAVVPLSRYRPLLSREGRGKMLL